MTNRLEESLIPQGFQAQPDNRTSKMDRYRTDTVGVYSLSVRLVS